MNRNRMRAVANMVCFKDTVVSEGIAYCRSLVVDPRNRLIFHADKEAILAGLPLGGHDRAEGDAFFGLISVL